jgi:amino acid adenylation domain-containing protein
MPTALRLTGALQSDALALALRDVINRHEPLRTVIVNVDGEPVGYVRALDPQGVAHRALLGLEDLSALQGSAREAALEQIIQRDSIAPFDLSRDLMIRARLIKLTDSEHVLTLVMHHIAGDGVSMGVFCRELTQAYEARISGNAPAWAPLSVSYADHAAWQRAWLEDSGELERQSQSWQTQLAGIPERLSLPTDYPRDASRSRTARFLPIEISAQTTAHLQSLANKHQTTLFTVLVALYGTLLGRLSNQSDVVIGSPVAGRTTAQIEGLVGFFLNTLALRVDASGHPDLDTLIARVKSSVNHALTHQELPFERLVEDLGVTRSLSHTPVYQASLSWQTQEAVELSLGDLSIKSMPIGVEQAKSDLALYLVPRTAGHISGMVEYDASLFKETSVTQWITWLVRSFEQVERLSGLSNPVDTLSLLDEPEHRQVLELSNRTPTSDLPLDTSITALVTLPELFEQQVERTPDAIALISGDEQFSYTELDARANQLARHLIAQGIGPEQIVAILLERSTAMIVSLLAVLKAGAAYLPMDPSYPKERLSFMLADSGATTVLTTGSILDETDLEASRTLRLDDYVFEVMLEQYPSHKIDDTERCSILTPYNLAYVIYTSGSTGKPKGASNTHQGGSNLVDFFAGALKLNSASRALQFKSFAFDASFLEIMPVLCSGGALFLIEDSAIRQDPVALGHFIASHQISHADIPPVMLPEIPVESLSSLHSLIVGGEASSAALVRRHASHCRMFNCYGPTEAAVCVAYAGPLNAAMDTAALVPIGRPIQNTQIYILDASLNPLPVGMVGELYIAGAGLARGYLGRSGLTAERFVANPFDQFSDSGSRMYRSGDLARWTEDGVLEYLGRADAQIKVRGFRIELGEIEAALLSIPGIAQCTVQARGEDSAKQLVAYLVAAAVVTAYEGANTTAEEGATLLETSSLSARLSETLPDYMVPAAFVVLESLPLTPNGKLDIRALPAPEITGESQYRAPVTEHEQLVASLFTELTGATRVGLDDSFFALGGHSLLAMRLISQLRTRIGLEISLRTLFEYPTVEGFATQLKELPATRVYQPLLPLNKAGSLPPLFCFPPAGGISTVYKNLSDELGAEHPLWGLQARGVDDDEQQIDQTVREAANTYVNAITEVFPEGPYYLIGMSIGGTIAHEAAVQLEENGHSVAAVFLLDTAVSYLQPEANSKSESENITELLTAFLKETTDQELPPDLDTLVSLFQRNWEAHGMIPVGTPRTFVMNALKNSMMSANLLKNHVPRKCAAPILFFGSSDGASVKPESFDWQPHTDQEVKNHNINAKHAEMLWQPNSYEAVAKVVHETMINLTASK